MMTSVVAFKSIVKVGVAGGSLVGLGLYAHRRRMAGNALVSAEEFNSTQMATFDSICRFPAHRSSLSSSSSFPPPPSSSSSSSSLSARSIDDSTSSDSKDASSFTLYKFHHCPFSAKVEVFLDVHDIPYTTVYVNRLDKRELAGVPYQKVPQLKVASSTPPANNEATQEATSTVQSCVLADATDIITNLNRKMLEQQGQGSQSESADVRQWREWSSSVLARFVVLEVNSSMVENATYLYNTKDLGLGQRIFFGLASPFLKVFIHPATTKRLLKQDNVTQEMVSTPMASLTAILENWVDSSASGSSSGGVTSSRFHGGDAPDLADCEVYGVLHGVRLHPLYSRVKATGSPRLNQWLNDMEKLM
jgi:glutathione S-transferase